MRAAESGEGPFFRSGLEFTVESSNLCLAMFQSKFQWPFSAVWFLQLSPNHTASSLFLALLGELSKHCCVLCRVSCSAADQMPACCLLPLGIASSSPLKGEQVPLRGGRLVKLSSGAWLLLMRPVSVGVS